MNRFHGTGVALVTPFDNKGAIDYPALKRVVNNVIDGGVDYLLVMGTTAENPTLSFRERQDILTFIVEVNDNRLPLVFGIGGNSTPAIIDDMRSYDLSGVDAILSVTPYYNKPNQEGLFRHYQELDKHTPLPIIVYNVPGRTSVNITPTTTLRIANELKNIIGIKEASGDIEQIGYILKDKPNDFLVISGDDNLTLPLIALGAVGVMSVAANALPREVSRYVRAALDGKTEEARAGLFRLMEFQDYIFEEGNPTGIKSAMAIKGLIDNNLRMPLVPSTEGYCSYMREILNKI